MPQQRADGELASEPTRQLGEQGHGVVERGLRSLIHGSGCNRTGYGPDQPAGECRFVRGGGTDDVGERGVVARNVGQQSIPQYIGPFAQR